MRLVHVHVQTRAHAPLADWWPLTQREAQDDNFRDEKGFLVEEIHKL